MATITKRDQYLGDIVDTRPGDYYVSVIDGTRYALLAGPFTTHQEALNMVERTKDLAQTLDSRAVFYGFGTCRTDTRIEGVPRLSILNAQLGLS